MNGALAGVVAAVGQRRALLTALQPVEVAGVLVEQTQGVVTGARRAVAGNNGLGADSTTGARRASVARYSGTEPPVRASGSPPTDRKSPHTSTPSQGANTAMPSDTCPSAGYSSSSSSPSPSLPGTGSDWVPPSASGRATNDVVLVVAVAQVALPRPAPYAGAAWCSRPPPATAPERRAGRARDRSRRGGQQRAGFEPRLGQHGGQQLQLLREVGGVDQHRLVPRAKSGRRGLPQQAGDHDRVAVDRDRSARRTP